MKIFYSTLLNPIAKTYVLLCYVVFFESSNKYCTSKGTVGKGRLLKINSAPNSLSMLLLWVILHLCANKKELNSVPLHRSHCVQLNSRLIHTLTSYLYTVYRSRIDELRISLSLLGIILRVLRLEASVCNAYMQTRFKPVLFFFRGGIKSVNKGDRK